MALFPPALSAHLSLRGGLWARLSSPKPTWYSARASEAPREWIRSGPVAFGFSPSGAIEASGRSSWVAGGGISEIDVAETFDGEASEAAARYAQAVFDLAKEAKALDAVEQDFAKFVAAWKESADLRAAARSPLIDPAEKAAALVAVAAKLGVSELGRKAIGAVAQNRRAAELPAIAMAYRALVARDRGARQVEIVSARPLGEAEKTAIVESLSKQLGAKVEAETSVDDALIGGFVVRVGSRQFDASIKSKLDALRLQLKSA
ncbi:MAG: ATP synthase F1 subunit delta [Hyphomonadaceae bacterium]